ncbi:MAG: 6-hydroxymethylpterin diphosphokinase MptE-like protein [Sulfuricurvum sp.]
MESTIQTNFDKNIQQMIHFQPILATKLYGIRTHERYEVFQGKDPIDINFLDIETYEFVYHAPVQDTVDFLETAQDREKIPFRYFFGIGNGVVISSLLKLSHVERIMIIEPNIELIYIVLNLFDFSKELADKRLIIELADEMDYATMALYLMNTASKTYSRLFELECVTDYYYRVYGEKMMEINKLITATIESNIVSHGNDMIDSLMGIEHHVINLPEMIDSIPVKSLSQYKCAKTAVIVSTGPSLSKQIPLLKEIQNYVTIISVDASFPILEKHGIKPDFVTILERVPETAKFFEENAVEFQKDVNFVMVSFVHHKVKEAIRSGNIVMVMRPNEYLRYFELERYGYLGHGMSAANLAHDLAIALNIPNVILIGQDLSFGADNTSHAEGHVYGEDEEDPSGHEVFIEKYGGNGEVRTTKYWILFKNGFERSIAQFKDVSTTINCTEGGARIGGTVEMPFSEAIKTYVDRTFVKEKFVPEYATDEEKAQYTQLYINKINHWIEHSVKSQEKVEEIFIKVQEAAEELNKMVEDNRLEELTNEYLTTLLDEIDSIKGLFDDEIFAQLYTIVLQSYILSLELDLAPITLEAAKTDIEKKSKMIKWILRHRYWLFIVAGGLDATRLTLLRATDQWPEHLRSQIKRPTKKEIAIDEEKFQMLKEKLQEMRQNYPQGEAGGINFKVDTIDSAASQS